MTRGPALTSLTTNDSQRASGVSPMLPERRRLFIRRAHPSVVAGRNGRSNDQGEIEGSVRQVRARKKADVDIFGTPVYRFAQGTGVQCLLLYNLCFHGEKRDQISRDRAGVDRDPEE